jgi:two-component system, sensor histidine kinase YesM
MKKHIQKFFDKFNFKTKLIIIISALIIFIIMLISTSNYILYSKNFTTQTINQTQQIINQISININTYMNELYRLTLSPYYNDSIMQELEENSNSLDLLNRKRKIESFLSSVMTLPRSEILRVYILTDKQLYSYTRTPYDMENYLDYAETDWYQQAKDSSSPVFIPVHSEKVFGDKKTQIFSIARRINGKKDNSKVLAVIKVDANYNGIKSICDQVHVQENGSLFIVDVNKNVLYKNSKLPAIPVLDYINFKNLPSNGTLTFSINHDRYIANISSLESTNLKVIAINSYNELHKNSIAIRNTTILLASLCALLAIGLLFLFVQNFFKPLFNIISLMKVVQNGNLDVKTEIKNNDEIGYLGKSFNKMIYQIKETLEKNTVLIKEVYESRYLQKQAQYNNLCSQIKPHFLYNTLNTISLLIKCNDNKNAITSIENLSCYLRGIMKADKNVTLTTEIQIVKAYLSIQKARYGDDLTYSISINPELESYIIPALTLQPIVENAIIHGCEVKRGQSEIQITTSVDSANLIILVRDNGKGIDASKLNLLNEELSNVSATTNIDSNSDSSSESIGLINVNKRLKLRFGDNFGLQIKSEAMKGTEVSIHLPFIPNSRKE